jgi:GT2 family glycosyltransferase
VGPNPRIVVVTPSLPERADFRAECVASVAAQTLQPVAHVVMVDYERAGPAAMLNRMLSACVAAGADWVAQLADDDLADPHHLELLAAHCADADIVYSWCRVEGRSFNPNREFDEAALRASNFIPATTMIRTRLCTQLGWRDDSTHGFEDWDFWLRALDAGARFVCVPEVSWTYRFHGANLSTGGGKI